MEALEGIAESQERAIGEALTARSIAIDYYQVLMHARFRSCPVVSLFTPQLVRFGVAPGLPVRGRVLAGRLTVAPMYRDSDRRICAA